MSTVTQNHIDPSTPKGGNLVSSGGIIQGATFRVWAPRAKSIYLNGRFNNTDFWDKDTNPSLALQRIGGGDWWGGFVSEGREGDAYKFFVVGESGSGYKRDPYARELSVDPPFPNANCILRAPGAFPWQGDAFQTPDYSNMIIYQAHVGTFFSKITNAGGTFLDVVEKIEYLQALGINVLQLLPIDEFETQNSLGYNGSDPFSPETRYGVVDANKLDDYLLTVNRLLSKAGKKTIDKTVLLPIPNQLKVLVDLCHLHGIAVVFDVVYNHAGGFEGDQQSLFFLDLEKGDLNASLYFTDRGWAGGLSYALWKQEVRQFLIDNALFHHLEYHVDGLRYDQISALVNLNGGTGWSFCQDLTNTVRFVRNRSLQNAEFWPVNLAIVQSTTSGGAGFDVTQHDGLRIGVRQAIRQASAGRSAEVNMDGIAPGLYPLGFGRAWQAVPCVENHDVVFRDRDPRIPRLADGSNTRSFFARSRSRVAMGLLLMAPGIPQIFMGQEFLEDKQWSDDPGGPNRIFWGGLDAGDKSMVDFLRFTRDLIRLRWTQPAVRSNSIAVFHVHNGNRVIAFHRWVEDEGRDLIVVASLNDQTLVDYQLGFPFGGRWGELFNSDVYDQWVNPNLTGNGGQVWANGAPMHGFNHSASVVVPPNSIVVFGG